MREKQKKILVFGEVLFDVYPDKTKKPGGAPFNFAFHLAQLGIETYLLTRIGDDKDGADLKKFIIDSGISPEFIQLDKKYSTGRVNITLKNGIPEFNIPPVSSYDFIDYDEYERTKKKEDLYFDIIYFGTLSKRLDKSRDTLSKIISSTPCSYRFCDINLRKPYYSYDLIYDTIGSSNILKVSEGELSLISRNKNDIKDLKKAMEDIYKEFDLKKLCLTMGSNGSIYFNGLDFYSYKSSRIKPVDTTGAGDAFASMLCYCLLKGIEDKNILKKCDKFAFDICSIWGAVPGLEDRGRIYEKYKE